MRAERCFVQRGAAREALPCLRLAGPRQRWQAPPRVRLEGAAPVSGWEARASALFSRGGRGCPSESALGPARPTWSVQGLPASRRTAAWAGECAACETAAAGGRWSRSGSCVCVAGDASRAGICSEQLRRHVPPRHVPARRFSGLENMIPNSYVNAWIHTAFFITPLRAHMLNQLSSKEARPRDPLHVPVPLCTSLCPLHVHFALKTSRRLRGLDGPDPCRGPRPSHGDTATRRSAAVTGCPRSVLGGGGGGCYMWGDGEDVAA